MWQHFLYYLPYDTDYVLLEDGIWQGLGNPISKLWFILWQGKENKCIRCSLVFYLALCQENFACLLLCQKLKWGRERWNCMFSLPVILDYFEGEKFLLTQPALWMNLSLTVPPKIREGDIESSILPGHRNSSNRDLIITELWGASGGNIWLLLNVNKGICRGPFGLLMYWVFSI